MRRIALTVNGVRREAEVEPRLLLVYFLRENLGLTGTNVGCDTSSCGACTVLLDGTPVYSCMTLAIEAQRREITTIEGLEEPYEQIFEAITLFAAAAVAVGLVDRVAVREVADRGPLGAGLPVRALRRRGRSSVGRCGRCIRRGPLE